jgi:hypothetical protein
MKKKKSKLIPRLIAVIAIVLLGFIVMTPWLLSTSAGKGWLIGYLNRKTSGKIAISSLSLGWLGPQEIQGFSFADAEKTVVIPQIKIESPLWSLLRSKPNLGHTVVDQLTLHLQAETKKEEAPIVASSTAEKPHRKKKSWEHRLLPFSGHVEVHQAELEIRSPGLDTIVFREMEIEANFPKRSGVFSLNLVGKTSQGPKQGSFHAKALFDRAQSKESLLDVEAQMLDLPMNGVDQLLSLFNPRLKGFLPAAIGPSLNLNVEAKASEKVFEMHLNANSTHFSAQMQTSRKNEQLSLDAPATARVAITPALSSRLFSMIPALSKLALQDAAELEVTVKELNIPITSDGLDLMSSDFQAELAVSKIEFSQELSVDEIKGSLFSKKIKEGVFGEINAVSRKNDKNYPFNMRGEISSLSEPSTHLALSIDTQQFQLPKTRLKWDDVLELEEPVTCTYSPLPSTLALLFPNHNIELPAQSSVALTLHRLTIPLSGGSEKIRAAASLKLPPLSVDKTVLITPSTIELNMNTWEQVKCVLPEITVGAIGQNRETKIENGEVEIRFYPTAGTLFTHFSARVQDGQIKGSLTLDHLDLAAACTTCAATLESNVEAKNFPVSILELASGKPLSALLGASMNMECMINSSPKSQNMAIKVVSSGLHFEGSFLVEEGRLTLKSAKPGLKGDFSLTPEGFRKLNEWAQGSADIPMVFDLAEPSTLTFQLSDLVVPLEPSSPLPALSQRWPRLREDLSQTAIRATVQIDKFPLLEKKSSQVLTLRDLKVDLSHPNLKAPLSFTLSGNVASTGFTSSLKEKQVNINGKIDQFIGNKGDLDLKNFSTWLKVDIHEFPVAFLDAFARLCGNEDCLPSHLIGPQLNANAEVSIQNWSGPVSLNVNAQHSRVSLVGNVNQGVLTLSEPIHAQITMTPQLSTLLLREVNPLAIKTLSAKNPFTMQIDSKGFSFPLYPFLLSKVNIPNATLEFGQISCENVGNLTLALSILKATRLSKEKQTKLWFTPIVAHLKEGVLTCERTEILVGDTYELATWGSVDLVKNKVNMILGLTAQCLEQAFGIKKLPQDYVLQLQMKGKMNEVKINSGAATAKIAALIAWQQDVGGSLFGKGFGGSLLNELLGTLGNLPDKDTSYPPAKRPFPWDDLKPKKTQKDKETSKAPKKKEKPLKQLLKSIAR